MPLSYFDLGVSPVDTQKAHADALQYQHSNHLAVAQAPSLRNALAAGLQRRQSQQALALGERRLALGDTRLGLQRRELGLRQGAYDYSKAQLPYEIGLGAVSGGVRLAGGFAALKDQERTKAFQDQQLLEGQRQAARFTTQATSLAEAYRLIKDRWDSQQYRVPPPDIVSTPLPIP